MTDARQFLLAMWEGGGTVPPQLGVAARLAAAGHRIHVIGDPTLEDRVTDAGYGFTAWVKPPHRTTLRPDDDVFKDWEAANPLVMLRNARDRFMAGPAGDFADETAAAIEAVGPDVLLADSLLLGAMVAGEGAGVPTAVLMPNIWMLPTPGLTPVGPGFEPARGVAGRCRDAVVRGMAVRIFDGGLPALNAARTRHGLHPLDHLWDQVLGCDRLLVLTSPTFDFGSDHVPPNASYVGPVLDDPPWAEPLADPWGSSDLPRVLVALSSTFQDQVGLLRRIVDALSRLPVRAVVTLGQMVDAAEVTSPTDDVVVVTTAPHGPLLEDADVVVTHCGHGTTMKALAAATPLVCIPMGRDQNDTAVRVRRTGAGVRLSSKASVAAIAEAVTTVLADDGYRQAAAEMAATIATELAAADLVGELESLAIRAGRSA